MSDDEKLTLTPGPLPEGELKGVKVGKRNLLLVRHEGTVRAIDDWCNHAGCLLSGGRVEDSMVVCLCHEIGFDLVSGKNVTSPGICDHQHVFRCEEHEDGTVDVFGFPDAPLPPPPDDEEG